MKPIVFLGPSLDDETARTILDAIYLPPAAQSDLVSAVVHFRPTAVGLIDGVFLQDLSVWHKEILYALSEGVRVYGASSMGALRAAELAEYGMAGIGEIYQKYASGELLDDDEVALAYLDDAGRYEKLSEPMVNVRETLAAARAARVITPDVMARIVAMFKALYFPDRTFGRVLADAGRLKVASRETLDELATFVTAHYVDLKRHDALALLRVMAVELEDAPERDVGSTSFVFERSSNFETLYNRDRRVKVDGVWTALDSISDFVAVNHPDYDALNTRALNRAVLIQLAAALGVDADDAAVDREVSRFRKKLRLESPSALDAWLDENHLSAAELRDILCQVAICRRFHRWYLYAMWMERSSKLLLDELRLENSYADWAKRAASQERLLGDMRREQTPTEGWSMRELVQEHRRWTAWSPEPDAEEWAQEAGFHSIGNLKVELVRAAEARRRLLALLAPGGPIRDEPGDPP